MDDKDVEMRAGAAGLQKALAEFRDDVLAAAKVAEELHRAVQKPLSSSDEPWPPMRVDAP